jgi:hypothetical protein
MWDEQTTFAANFPGFVPILEDDGTDYRLAATTVVFNGPYVPDDGDELLVNDTVLGGCAG